MSGFLNGKHAGFLSEEIFAEDVNIEAVDGDLLAEELEKAQEDLFIEQEKFSTAIEAECETNETVDEIEAALESGSTDIVYAKLLVNKLIKNNSIFYGNSKPLVSALESDRGSDARSILQAGLEDGKGMINAIKEFIAKVWQKIKDAFAWVWKKMKDFWAWLTGANKKVEEKKEEAVVAASAVNAAVDKSDDIKKAAEDVMENKNPDDILKSFRKRQNITEALNANKIDGNSGLTVQDGEFKGKDIGSLSKQDFEKWMSEGKNKDIAVDVVIENIIVEEVAKQTGLAEEKVSSYISKEAMKKMQVYALDPSLAGRVAIIVKKNILDSNVSELENKMALPIILNTGYHAYAERFAYKYSNPLENYEYVKKQGAIDDKVKKIKDSIAKQFFVNRDFKFLIKNFFAANFEMHDWIACMSESIGNSMVMIIDIDNMLNSHWENSKRNEMDAYKELVNKFSYAIPVGIDNKVVSYINQFERGTFELDKDIGLKLDKINFDDSFIKDVSGAVIGKYRKEKMFDGIWKNLEAIERKIVNLVDIADRAVKNTEKTGEKYIDGNGSGQYRNDKDWSRVQRNLINLVSNINLFNPALIMKSARAGNDALSVFVSTMDIPGAIAQAAKEFDSSKFKFDKK